MFIDRFKVWIDIIEDAYRKWTKKDRKEANRNLENYALKVGKIHEILETYRASLGAIRIGYLCIPQWG